MATTPLHDRYDPSKVSAKFMDTLTVAGLLAGDAEEGVSAPLAATSSSSSSKRLASETPHEERLRQMMQRLCLDLREAHFPGSNLARATAKKRHSVEVGAAHQTPSDEAFHALPMPQEEALRSALRSPAKTPGGRSNKPLTVKIAATAAVVTSDAATNFSNQSKPQSRQRKRNGASTSSPVSTILGRTEAPQPQPLINRSDSEDELNLSKYALEKLFEERSKNAAKAEALEDATAIKGDGTFAGTHLLYPPYELLTSDWTKAALDDPHHYTEFLLRQSQTTRQVIENKDSGTVTATLAFRAAPATAITGTPQRVAHQQQPTRARLQPYATNFAERHPIDDAGEAFTLQEAIVPAVAVVSQHLPAYKKSTYAELSGMTVVPVGMVITDQAVVGGTAMDPIPHVLPPLASRSKEERATGGDTRRGSYEGRRHQQQPPSQSKHAYTAPLLMANQSLPALSPYTMFLGKETIGRRFQPVCPADTRDHRTHQYTAEEELAMQLGHRLMPDGPIVSSWRVPSATSVAALEAKRRAQRKAHEEGYSKPQNATSSTSSSSSPMMTLCEMMKAELAALEEDGRILTAIAEATRVKGATEEERISRLQADINGLRSDVLTARTDVEGAVEGVEALKTRRWEKDAIERGGDRVFVDLQFAGVEDALPHGSSLRAVRALASSADQSTPPAVTQLVKK